MAKPVTYLQLAPEFGGTKFGPFQGVEIRLGSDPGRNDIVLPEALGVSPEHVKVLQQQDDSFIIAPTQRTATVFLWRADGRPATQITTPTAVSAGDGFSVVTAEGPRFFILQEMQAGAGSSSSDDSAAAGGGKGKDSDVGQGIMAEIKRIGLAKVMTSKVGNFFQTAWMMVKTGTIFSPRYIVMGMMMIIPMLTALAAGGIAFGFWRSSSTKQAEIDGLERKLDFCGGGGGDEWNPTVAELTQRILGDVFWNDSLTQDDAFNAAFLGALKEAFQRQDRYSWVYKESSTDFTRVKESFDSHLGPELSRVMSYTAAHPGKLTERKWSLLQSTSSGDRACGRGPLLMSYRQGHQLGLTVVPDALAEPAVASGDDKEAWEEMLLGARARLGITEEPDWEQEEIDMSGQLRGNYQCLYIDRTDDRDDPNAIASALADSLGPKKSRGVPSNTDIYWITARLIKYYAADFDIGFEDLDLGSGSQPTLALKDLGHQGEQWAVDSAAEVVARSVAVPCMAMLEDEKASHLGELPSLVECGVLRLLVDRDVK